jgi:tryptophanyl-tRNA synthetase
MSKSKNNIIDIFASEKTLKKQVHSIKTNSTPIEEPKDWKKCNLFNIYKLLASKEEIEKMKTNYKTGGYGFGHAKKELMDLILNNFSKERERFNYFICNPDEVEQILQIGAKKAKVTANTVLERVRKKLGY